MKLFTYRNLLILVVIVLGVGLFIWKSNDNAGNKNVKTAKVERGLVSEDLILSGEIKAEEEASLNFLTSGELDYIGVKEGQFVQKGDVLAKLDSTNAYQTYLQAQSDLRRYQASLDNTYDQLQGHTKDESFTQIETRTAAESNKDKAYRNLVVAQKNLANLSLKAPIDGIVTAITHPFNGINTSITESQIQIVNPNTIYFDVSADQTDVIRLSEGQKVKILLDSFPEREAIGQIYYIGYTPKVGEVGTVYQVKVSLLNDFGPNIKIGMSGDAKFVLSEKSDTLFVPLNFVKTDSTGKYLDLDNKKTKKYIEIGIEGEERVEVVGDVKEGDIVYD